MTKHCNYCHKDLDIEQFYINPNTGYKSAYCKPCCREKNKIYVAANREGIKLYQRLYHKDYKKIYYSLPEVKEKRKQYVAKYRKENREKHNAYQREYQRRKRAA